MSSQYGHRRTKCRARTVPFYPSDIYTTVPIISRFFENMSTFGLFISPLLSTHKQNRELVSKKSFWVGAIVGYIYNMIKQFVVTNCSKERLSSIVNETLKNGIFMLKDTSKESNFHADSKYISFIKNFQKTD